ncbi:MAG: hypothetical protein Q8835_02560, partial [Sweet potato little leaf phytoplasma]|nr:hypothetical protein [Sweet potato little leaf phytoplasma]
MNFEKSMFMVSPNTSEEMIQYVKTNLRVNHMGMLGQYLGLPSQNARNKQEIFQHIKDRVWKTLQGWKRNFFSAAGREVLIKSVAQAIPNYAMSCFKFPLSFCNDLNSLCARFWWGGSEEGNKIHWHSWRKLCINKDHGGLGFRDLTIFNQAMLAKQSWRLIKYPNSLLAKVLKGRYYKTGNFLKASLGNNPSYVWRSLLWGRELFMKGFRWRIGSGVGIDASSDPWIPREGSCKPIAPHPNTQNLTVANLIHRNGTWNEQMIRDLYIDQDANLIINIPLNPQQKEDIIIWQFDPKGIFSVKSAYRLGMQSQNQSMASVSNYCHQNSLWKSFWKTPIPSKVKLCGWKIYKDILPTKGNLYRRGIDLNTLCLMCRDRKETTSHLFWECKATKGLWPKYFHPSDLLCLNGRKDWEAMDYLESIWKKSDSGDSKTEKMSKSLILCWLIWNYRNSILLAGVDVLEQRHIPFTGAHVEVT